MVRKKITVDVEDLSLWEFEGTLDDIKRRVNDLYEKYGGDARISYGQYDRWDDSYSFRVSVTRDETDEERDKRLKEEKAAKDSREERERKELASLLAKYGNPSDK